MAKKVVDIGFLEEQTSYWLHPKFFPSKVGGKPSWLDLKNLPSPEKLTCKLCRHPLVFLCQVYAPFDELTNCFHRTIFIFVCRNGACCQANTAENFMVLRCQLPRKNEFYDYEPSSRCITSEFSMAKWSKLCELCGMKGTSHCSKCKSTYYCSRHHQILDWQKEHKELCPMIQDREAMSRSDFVVTEAGKSLLFNEFEIVEEEEDQMVVRSVNVKREFEKLQQLVQERKAGMLEDVSEAELQQYTGNVSDDKAFKKFSKRVARHPNQVLRYDRGGTPLWITGDPKRVVNPPNCQYCNGERQFEFQIMPQLLNFINVGLDPSSIDWGVLVIYTCKASCTQGPAYKAEFLIKQDLAN